MVLRLTLLDYIIILGEITVVYMVGCLKCGPIISVFFWDVAIFALAKTMQATVVFVTLGKGFKYRWKCECRRYVLIIGLGLIFSHSICLLSGWAWIGFQPHGPMEWWNEGQDRVWMLKRNAETPH